MARNKNYHKLARQTGFIKRPSVRQKVENARASHRAIANEVADYDEKIVNVKPDGTIEVIAQKASECSFGIFNKKGYRAIKIFKTREEAENELKTWRKPEYYDIREIEWFEEDKENYGKLQNNNR